VVVWDLSGQRRLDQPFSAGAGFPQWPYFAISPDGRTIAVPSSPGAAFARSGSVHLTATSDLGDRRTIRFRPPRGSPMPLAFSPDSRTLAVGSYGCGVDASAQCSQSVVGLWDVASGAAVPSSFPGTTRGRQILSLAYSPDGSMLAAGGASYADNAGRVWVWDAGAGRLVQQFDVGHREVNQVAFTPDGSLLVVAEGFGDGGSVVFWNTRTHRVVGRFRVDQAGVFALDVGDDGRTIATAGMTAGVRLWDVGDGTKLSRIGPSFTGLSGIANTVDLSPDGAELVGADVAGSVVLWDVATETQLGDRFPGPGSTDLVAASFTPDGHHIVVVSDSGAGWLWDVDPSDWAGRACAEAGRSMTHDEWQDFLPDRPYHATCGS
jgi:WD40 repeat protein